jgi:hypothetical protein
MPGRPSPKPKTFFRKVERVFIGFLMTIMAFVLEKIVMRGIRKEGGDPKTTPETEATSITTKGGEIDFEPEL